MRNGMCNNEHGRGGFLPLWALLIIPYTKPNLHLSRWWLWCMNGLIFVTRWFSVAWRPDSCWSMSRTSPATHSFPTILQLALLVCMMPCKRRWRCFWFGWFKSQWYVQYSTYTIIRKSFLFLQEMERFLVGVSFLLTKQHILFVYVGIKQGLVEFSRPILNDWPFFLFSVGGLLWGPIKYTIIQTLSRKKLWCVHTYMWLLLL